MTEELDWRIVADGLAFPEGPVVCRDGSVLLVEIPKGRITRVQPDGAKSTVAEPGGGPNGLAVGPDGSLYLCNNGGLDWREWQGMLIPAGQASGYRTGSIQRVDPATGTVETLFEDSDTGPLRGPNDLVFDGQGGFWFTDNGKFRNRDRDVTGVFYARVGDRSCREVIFPLDQPNGIGLSPDGRTLYVAETGPCKLWAFDVVAPGEVRLQPNHRRMAGRVLHSPDGLKYFDSLAVEEGGNICIATIGEGGITVVAPSGLPVEFVPTPDPFATNIAFGGSHHRQAFATLSGYGRLAVRSWPRPGLKLAYEELL